MKEDRGREEGGREESVRAGGGWIKIRRLVVAPEGVRVKVRGREERMSELKSELRIGLGLRLRLRSMSESRSE